MISKYPQLHDVKWLSEEIKTKSLRRIAKELGCHNTAVMWAVRKYNLTVPYRSSHYYPEGSHVWNKGISTAAIGKSRPKTFKTCENCSKSFAVPYLKRKFCSYECFKLNLIKKNQAKGGKNHYNWKGGITPLNHKIRTSQEFIQWRKTVLERDNYKCVLCGSNESLEVDHIKQFAYYPELRFEVSNGRTLCKTCHKKTETHSRKITLQVDNAS